MSGQVRARFITKHSDYRISDVPISVPAKLGRRGLSEVINHLLGREDNDEHIPFDFSIKDTLIRTPLSAFLAAHHLSAEAVQEIEYMPAATLSDEKDTIDTPAWVGCMTRAQGAQSVVAGCFDGTIQLVGSASHAIEQSHQCHADPVRAVHTWSLPAEGSRLRSVVATASKDQTVKLWGVSEDDSGKKQTSGGKSKNKRGKAQSSHLVQPLAQCTGHINSVESVDLLHSNGTAVLLSGDWAGNIMGWNVQRCADDDYWTQVSEKKRRVSRGENVGTGTSADAPTILSPIFTFRAHAQSVSALQVLEGTKTAFTASWDHSLKQWDMDRQDVVSVFTSGSKISTSVHANPSMGLVATSHTDGKIRLWDTRLGNASDSSASNCQSIINSTRSGVPQWVSHVQWHPETATVFACTDYGGVLRVWDVRSTKVPLGEKETHDGKALCAQWVDGSVFSGGSDCAIHATNFS
eukprot:GSChrysophyteH1.ASY1.ANO1.2246.1 assembled CDS